MDGFDLSAGQSWKPLAWLGFKHSFFTIDGHIVLQTWIILLILLGTLLICRYFLNNKRSVGYFLTTIFVRSFKDLTEQTIGKFPFNHFAFITALFIFILICNSAAALPWLDEPTRDINTTLALGIISFIYTQFWAIRTQGLLAYIGSYFAPLPPYVPLLLPLNLIGKLSNIISISFRLFGNIFGGFMIGSMYERVIAGSVLWETVGLISGLNFVILFFFGLFEGFLQAFVFAMLSLTYLSIALQSDDSTTKDTR